jgi:hypothetical protein
VDATTERREGERAAVETQEGGGRREEIERVRVHQL